MVEEEEEEEGEEAGWVVEEIIRREEESVMIIEFYPFTITKCIVSEGMNADGLFISLSENKNGRKLTTVEGLFVGAVCVGSSNGAEEKLEKEKWESRGEAREPLSRRLVVNCEVLDLLLKM